MNRPSNTSQNKFANDSPSKKVKKS